MSMKESRAYQYFMAEAKKLIKATPTPRLPRPTLKSLRKILVKIGERKLEEKIANLRGEFAQRYEEMSRSERADVAIYLDITSDVIKTASDSFMTISFQKSHECRIKRILKMKGKP